MNSTPQPPGEPVAFVTGASQGIGLAIATVLAERGATVAAVARSPERLGAAVDGLDAAIRTRVVPVVGDVRDEGSVRAALQQVTERFGRLDTVVNAAGLSMDASRRLADTSTGEWLDLVHTNLTGTYLVCREALPLLEAEGGTIVNVLSLAAWRAKPGSSLYAATKFGARALTESLIEEYRGTPVRITAVAPGQVDTPVWDRKPEPPAAEARAKMLRPRDIAETVAWLLALPPGVHVPSITVVPWYGAV